MSQGPVLSNTSPLIALMNLGQLWLFEQLFGTVVIAPAVALEVGPSFALPHWITQQALALPIAENVSGLSLGAGETETISLAIELGARLVILDDRPARRKAQSLGLPVIGILGVILSAKKRGLITAIKPCLDTLIQNDFRIAQPLYDQILVDAGEH